MIRTFAKNAVFGAALAACLVAGACQTKPKNEIEIVIGPDGKMTVVAPAGASAEDQALATLMAQALNGESEGGGGSAANVWRTDAEDNLTHLGSGAQCAKTWGKYARTDVEVYIPDGSNVGCNYGHPTAGAALTFYVYRSSDTLKQDVDGAMDAMKQRFPVSREVEFTKMPGGQPYQARTIAFSDGDGRATRSSVLIADVQGWRLKIRLTCSTADAAELEMSAGIALIGQSDRVREGLPPAGPPHARNPV